MKKMIIVSLLIVSHAVCGTWTLGVIDNKAVGLVLQQAWNYKPDNKVRVLPSITNALKKAAAKNRTAIVVNYEVDSHGLAISALSASGQQMNIFLDSQAVHNIEWSRKKTVSIAQFPTTLCSGSTGQFCARAMIQRQDGTVLANPSGQAYESEKLVFDLVITGDAQNFAVTLVPA